MKFFVFLTAICGLAIIAGCGTASQGVTSLPASSEYPPKEPLAMSLFPADQAVMSDDVVARILSTRLRIPAKVKMALMRFPANDGSRFYGRYYWRDEDYLKLLQSQVEVLTMGLRSSESITEVVPLPSLMIPSRVSIPTLREAALRMQADLLLVFRVASDTYSQYRTFSKDKVKAYSTCELVLIDIRTGLAPFTRVMSRERTESKAGSDLDLSETMRRAESESASEALKAAGEDLVAFMKAVPKSGD